MIFKDPNLYKKIKYFTNHYIDDNLKTEKQIKSWIISLDKHQETKSDNYQYNVEVFYYDEHIITLTVTNENFHDIYSFNYESGSSTKLSTINYSRDLISDISKIPEEYKVKLDTTDKKYLLMWNIIQLYYPQGSSGTEIWVKLLKGNNGILYTRDLTLLPNQPDWSFYSIDLTNKIILDEKVVKNTDFDKKDFIKITDEKTKSIKYNYLQFILYQMVFFIIINYLCNI